MAYVVLSQSAPTIHERCSVEKFATPALYIVVAYTAMAYIAMA